MKSLITTLLTVGLIAPGATYALSLDQIIEAAKAGNGTYTESHSSVSTGGQTAHGGESVHTNDVSASSHVETTINAGNNGGEVKVKIETGVNGETKTEEYSKPLEKDKSVKVEANAESNNGDYTAEVKVNGETIESETNASATASSQTAAASIASESKIVALFSEKIPNLFKKVLDFFWWA